MGVPLCKDTRSDTQTVEEVPSGLTEKEKLIEILRAIAFSDMRDFVDLRLDGLRAKRIEEIAPTKLYALKTYWANETRRSFRIHLHDKVKALDMLLKINERNRPKMVLTNED